MSAVAAGRQAATCQWHRRPAQLLKAESMCDSQKMKPIIKQAVRLAD